MKMGLRWFGEGYDTVSLEKIRQVPGVSGVITTLYGAMPGEDWEKEEILALKQKVEDAGLEILGIESVNVHDDIKIGLPSRDRYIEAYIRTIRTLAECGIHLICYNFMPVFDWTRTDLAKPRPDGSTVLAYDQRAIDAMDPDRLFASMEANAGGHVLPGWEPERLVHLKELFARYSDVDEKKLWENLIYFLKAIMPTCEKYEVKMAIHPDDPGWSVFGLPRIMTSGENLRRMTEAVDSPCNGVTLCTGSLGTNPDADLPGIVRMLKGKIFFAHVRNMEHTAPGCFEESAHLSSDGSFDLFAIMKALYETGFDGVMRPDHGRMIWGEQAMPGYGLYDRALGSQYLLGLWEAISKTFSR